ncbi:hypothetical protein BDR26DRAFT_925765 [Obelidium mucronatum]|nr:hypothetical protein BDR26DRAFT_925765 [Obelidium mucronatum]
MTGSSINSLLAASSSKPVLLGSNGQPLGLGRLGVDKFHYLLTGKVPPQKTPLPPKVLPPSVNEAKIDSDDQDTSCDQLYRVIPLEESYLIQVSIIAGHTAKFAVAADAFGIEVSMTPKNLSPYLYTKDGLQASEFKNDLQSQAILASFQAEPLPTIEFVIPLDKKALRDNNSDPKCWVCPHLRQASAHVRSACKTHLDAQPKLAPPPPPGLVWDPPLTPNRIVLNGFMWLGHLPTPGVLATCAAGGIKPPPGNVSVAVLRHHVMTYMRDNFEPFPISDVFNGYCFHLAASRVRPVGQGGVLLDEDQEDQEE